MAIDDTRGRTASFFERAKALFTRPKEAWPDIDRDMTPSGELFTRYAAPLAALAPVVGLLAGRVFGWSPFGFSIFGQLFTAVGGYALSMVNLLVMSFIASRLAPRFGGEGSPRDAFKLIVYSSTAAWLASAVAMIPGLGLLGLGSLFSLYLYFTGIGPMMKVPEAEKGRFGAVTIVCAIVLNTVTMSIANAPAMMMGGSRPHIAVHGDWGNSGFDPQAIRDAEREMQNAFSHGKVQAVEPSQLQALLPANIGDFKRTGTENAGGPGGGHADGTYEEGDKTFRLRIVDLAGFGMMAQIGSAFHIEKDKENSDGFDRVSSKNGKLTIEQWDNREDEGTYRTMVAERFLIEAKGEADNFDELKQAVGSIDANKLAALSK